jgi:hypothetical protein
LTHVALFFYVSDFIKDNPIFKTELNEERIINDFKSTIKQRYLLLNTHLNSTTTNNSIYYQASSASSSVLNTNKNNFNLVTKAMSKYNYMSSYEQAGFVNSKSSDYRLANTSNSCSKALRQQPVQQPKYPSSASKALSNSNSNNNNYSTNHNSSYQLPDRRAKKPKIDIELNSKVSAY